MKSLIEIWHRQARRIDALSLRERAILFVSLAVAMVAAVDSLVLTPHMAQQKAMASQLRQQAAAVEKLRVQLGSSPADTPAAKLTREIERTTGERAALDAQIAHAAVATGVALPAVLERVLRRHDKLTLLGLSTALPDTGTGSAPGAASAGAVPAAHPLQRQAVDIRMRGSYPDLARYVADTEAALPALRWGGLRLVSQGGSAELNAQVFLTGGTP